MPLPSTSSFWQDLSRDELFEALAMPRLRRWAANWVRLFLLVSRTWRSFHRTSRLFNSTRGFPGKGLLGLGVFFSFKVFWFSGSWVIAIVCIEIKILFVCKLIFNFIKLKWVQKQLNSDLALMLKAGKLWPTSDPRCMRRRWKALAESGAVRRGAVRCGARHAEEMGSSGRERGAVRCGHRRGGLVCSHRKSKSRARFRCPDQN